MSNQKYLDISIPELKHRIKDEVSAKALFTSEVKIEEKYDGTKLTIVRNSLPYNKDYTKNWIVAYKGNILYPSEFNNIPRENIRKSSIGISQYAIVHDTLKAAGDKLKVIPKNTEFFVEFIMDKPTLTRDYKQKHSLVLLAYSKTTFREEFGKLTTVSTEFNTDANLATYSTALGIRLPNLIFKGKLSNLPKGIVDKSFKEYFNEYLPDFKSAKSYFDKEKVLRKAFTSFESSFGGSVEGVVIKDSSDIIIGKYVSDDQYSREAGSVRNEKKFRWKMDYESESSYVSKLKEVAKQIVSSFNTTGNLEKDLEIIATKVYATDLSYIEHQKKDNFKKQDDLYLTTKTVFMKHIEGNNWCVFQGRFQPPTKAHIDIIKDCLDKKGFDGVYIVMVKGDKNLIDNPFSDELREEIIDKELIRYRGRYKIKFTKSGLLPRVVSDLDQNINAIVGGTDRKADYEKFAKQMGIPFVEIKRKDSDISATKVRDALLSDDIDEFRKNMGWFDKKMYNRMKLEMMAKKESRADYKYDETTTTDSIMNMSLVEFIGGL